MLRQDSILNSIDVIIQEHKVFLVGGYLRNYYIKNEISKALLSRFLGD